MSHIVILEIGIAVLLVASVGLLANKLKFSVIPFFIIIGMVLGNKEYPSFVSDVLVSIDNASFTAGFNKVWGFFTFSESKPFIDFMGRFLCLTSYEVCEINSYWRISLCVIEFCVRFVDWMADGSSFQRINGVVWFDDQFINSDCCQSIDRSQKNCQS